MLARYRTIGSMLRLTIPIVLTLMLAGCDGEKPTPTPTPEAIAGTATPVVTILMNPTIPEMTVGAQVALAAEATGVNLKITWHPKRGKVSNTEGPSTIYTAPATPGIDTVDVTVMSDSGSTTKTVTFTVVEAAAERPAATNTRGVTPALTRKPTSAPTSVTTVTSTLTRTPTSSTPAAVAARATATSTPPRGTLAPSPVPVTSMVVDSDGVETQISDMRFTFSNGYDFTQSLKSLTVEHRGGYVRVPFSNIERIDRVTLPKIGEYKAVMKVTLWNGQTIEGLVGEPYGGTPSFSGKIGGVEYSILAYQAASVVFTESATSQQSNGNSSESQGHLVATVKTGTGDEIALRAVETIWLGNRSDPSDEQWFSIMHGQSKLKVDLAKVRTIDVEQRDSTKYVVVHLKDGSKVEGTDAYGWSLAGRMELGLFLIPIESLVSATFKP